MDVLLTSPEIEPLSREILPTRHNIPLISSQNTPKKAFEDGTTFEGPVKVVLPTDPFPGTLASY